jgi:hypothetical protein
MNQQPLRDSRVRAFGKACRAILLGASATLAILSGSMQPAQAMDTDLYSATSSSAAAPNVLIILDNTSNWSRQNQHFPGGITQGQAEVRAIKTAISTLPGHINIGLMEFATLHNDTGGFIRQAIVPMGQDDTAGPTNVSSFSTTLTSIFNNINDPTEKVNSGQQYGDLMRDAYNYLAGLAPFATSSNVDSTKADANGYTTRYTMFKSPLSADATCATTFIIFIGNPNAQGPVADSSGNKTALSALGGDTNQLPLPNYSLTTQTLSDGLGYSSSCYTSAPSTIESSFSTTCSGYDSCSYSTNDLTSVLSTCSTGTQRYSVVQTTPTVSGTTTTSTTTNTGKTSLCYAASTNWSASSDTGTSSSGTAFSCPAGSTTTSGGTTTNTSYSCSYSVSSSGGTSCGTQTSTSTGSDQTSTSQSNSCYSNLNSWNSASDRGSLSCPSTTTTTSGGVTTTTSYTCSYTGSLGSATGCNGNKNYINITQTAVPTVTVSQPTYKFPLTQTVTKTVTTGTTTGSTNTTLGNTSSCYSSQASCSTADYTCATGSTCACGTPTTTTGVCPAGYRYQVLGNYAKSIETATGTYSTDTATYNADEWARFLHDGGVPVGASGTKQYANVYTIDVYNAQPDAKQSSLLSSMARNGGGKYFSATSEAGILSALNTIFSEIQSVNSTFASAALPISATNRAQNKNEVYIGMFRPETHPRWFGNLKRYAIGKDGTFFLSGSDGKDAVSATTGFVTPCGVSWWTTDSAGYWFDTINDQSRIFITQATNSGTLGTAWQPAGNDDRFAKGQCGTTGTWSDSPDGPAVEKGGAAQILRNQVSRNIYTVPAGTAGPASFSTFGTSTTGLSSDSTINTNIAKFIMGQDVTGEIAVSPSTATRPSVHGDVIHSQPKPVDYGGSTGVVIYYGANDGMFHAVSGSNGQELWSFVAPETYSNMQRLLDNYPLVLSPYPTPPSEATNAANAKREFFFDGSSGLYQNADNSKVWIYTAMRRGGRMMYAFDVTSPTAPTLKWRRGCPNQSDDTGCTTGLSGIGQTWSTPRVAAKVNGYKSGGTHQPVVIVGGGYDTCEDVDSTAHKAECTTNRTPKGKYVYVLDANTGAVVATFETTRSVVADASIIDLNADGVVDAAYVADTGGNLYRIDFGAAADTDTSNWKITKVAYTNVTPSDSYRKFLFAPAVLAYKGYVYVGIVSGDREHPLSASYPYTTPVLNRAYVYLDDISRTTATDLDAEHMLSRNTANCNSTKVVPGGQYYGWYMDLAAGRGEQGVTSALFQAGLMTFSTNRPVTSQTCPSSLGEARNYVVNLLTGAGAIGVPGLCGGNTSAIVTGGGLPPSPVTATVGDNGNEWTVVIGACKEGVNCSPIKPSDFLGTISSKRTRTYWKTNVDNK